MTSMQGPGINRSMFSDANGERIVVRDGSSYTFTLRDLGQQVLREVSWSQASGWRWGKDYVYRDGVLLASHSTSDGLRYHFGDHLTSPRLVANRCGERVLEHRTSSFGLDLPAGGAQSPDRRRFTMHERDLGQLSSTLDDLDSMHARTYWPSLGRFVSVDPGRSGVDPFAPQSWNQYGYYLGNPVKYHDPNGEAAALATAIPPAAAAVLAGTPVAASGVIVAGTGAGGWELGRLLGETTIGYMTVDEAVTQSFEMLLEGSASLWAKLANRADGDAVARIVFASPANDARRFIETKVATVLEHVAGYGSPPPDDPDARSRLKNVYERMKKQLEQAERKLKNLKGKSREEYARFIKQTAETLEKWWQSSS